jgi:hypothetical protein
MFSCSARLHRLHLRARVAVLCCVQVGAQAHHPHSAACKLYVRSKELQAGRRLGAGARMVASIAGATAASAMSPDSSSASSPRAFSPMASAVEDAPRVEAAAAAAAGDLLQRRGGSGPAAGGRVASLGRSTGDAPRGRDEGLEDACTGGRGSGRGTAAGSSGGNGGPQSYFMSPDTRSWILHRHALAAGCTGVEDVTAAAVQVAQESDALNACSGSGGSSARAIHSSAGVGAQPSNGTTGGRGGRGLAVPVSPDRIADVCAMGDTRYDLVSFVQHSGSLSGGHYISHAKHRVSGSWHTFDDAYVDELPAASVAGKEAYLLFYVRRRSPSHVPVPLPQRDDAAPLVYVSRAWWLRYLTISIPGPICNADILCDHGFVKRQLADSILLLTVALPFNQYQALAAAYGASGPPLRETHACHECKVEAAALADRRSRENSNILAVDTTMLQGDQVGCGTRSTVLCHSMNHSAVSLRRCGT